MGKRLRQWCVMLSVSQAGDKVDPRIWYLRWHFQHNGTIHTALSETGHHFLHEAVRYNDIEEDVVRHRQTTCPLNLTQSYHEPPSPSEMWLPTTGLEVDKLEVDEKQHSSKKNLFTDGRHTLKRGP